MKVRITGFCVALLFADALTSAQNVEPMVGACFDQGAPFNEMCPNSAVAGCGPVAVAQILSYYRQPEHGAGRVSYVNPKDGNTINENLADFQFDWLLILNKYTYGAYTDSEAAAVAKLMYACGVAMNVSYGESTSTTDKHRMVYNLQHHLYMSPESRYLNRQYYSTPEWIEMLNSQLTARHPVFYRGTTHYNNKSVGHMFVIDGVNDSGLYHANWGHNGVGNKFTDLNVLNQGAADGLPGGKNVCYNFKQAMMINCYPVPDLHATPLQWCDMEEPITINNDVTVNRIEVKPGQDFILSTKIANCSAEACSVNYKWLLMHDGEEIMDMANGHWDSVSPFGVKRINRQITIPRSITDGNYSMILMTKSSLTSDWEPVRDNPVNNVDIEVSGDNVTITVPNQYNGDPELYMSSEPFLSYDSISECLEILCELINPTDNNYEGTVRIEINTENSSFEYQPDICVYGGTDVGYRFIVPTSSLDQGESAVKNVKIWYKYNGQEIALGTSRPSRLSGPIEDKEDGNITIFTLQGYVVAVINRNEVNTVYKDILSSLPKGVYIIKEGLSIRKILK